MPPLATAMEAMARMYEAHAAIEDTMIYPAWKSRLSDRAYEETGDRFETIEHDQFGGDGFAMAVQKITAIETTLGLDDLAEFTAPSPPPA
jgi:hypothetical protein